MVLVCRMYCGVVCIVDPTRFLRYGVYQLVLNCSDYPFSTYLESSGSSWPIRSFITLTKKVKRGKMPLLFLHFKSLLIL